MENDTKIINGLIIQGSILTGVEDKNIKYVSIPDFVTTIDYGAFRECESLIKIDIPDSVRSIGDEAFYGCTSLTEINIPSSITYISDEIFLDCKSLKKIKINISNDKIVLNFPMIAHFFDAELEKTNDGFLLSLYKKGEDNTIDKSKQINLALIHYYIEFFSDSEKIKLLDKLSNNMDIAFGLYLLSKNNEKIQRDEEIDYLKIFKYNYENLNELINCIANVRFHKYPTVRVDFYKLCENIGVLNSSPTIIETKLKSADNKVIEIDYAQKAKEFLKDRMLDGSFNPIQSHYLFNSMKCDGFKREFADFFMNKKNFFKLIEINEKDSSFISSCYNEFEEVQLAHTNNRGRQRQLAPTIEFFIKYFDRNKFEGVTEENSKIAEMVGHYFSNQTDFDVALKIMEEKERRKTPDHILGEELREDTVFERVGKLINDIRDNSADTLSTLVELFNKTFTFEWLNKSDPVNLVLGKLCSSCAHLEGAGNGIMRASIIHPDVQNIVIRDYRKRIVAKSTIYVNRKEGYAVCNNFMANCAMSDADKDKIYKKFKQAIKSFAEKYNEKNPNNPLKIITVGMGMNDLSSQIIENDKESEVLYKAIDYSKFAFNGSEYGGDSDNGQYIVWTSEDMKNDNSLGV